MEMGAEFWAKHVAAAERLSLSAGSYARQHGLAVSTLYAWQRKLRADSDVQSARPSDKFVAVRVSDPPPVAPVACTLMLPSGVRLSLSTLPAPEWLAALGHALQGVR